MNNCGKLLRVFLSIFGELKSLRRVNPRQNLKGLQHREKVRRQQVESDAGLF
jgi:hypothetical protein